MGGIKKLETTIVSWKDVIHKVEVEPEGYSTAQQISDATGVNSQTVRNKLKALVSEGKMQAIKGMTKEGKHCWFYKD